MVKTIKTLCFVFAAMLVIGMGTTAAAPPGQYEVANIATAAAADVIMLDYELIQSDYTDVLLFIEQIRQTMPLGTSDLTGGRYSNGLGVGAIGTGIWSV